VRAYLALDGEMERCFDAVTAAFRRRGEGRRQACLALLAKIDDINPNSPANFSGLHGRVGSASIQYFVKTKRDCRIMVVS